MLSAINWLYNDHNVIMNMMRTKNNINMDLIWTFYNTVLG